MSYRAIGSSLPYRSNHNGLQGVDHRTSPHAARPSQSPGSVVVPVGVDEPKFTAIWLTVDGQLVCSSYVAVRI